MTIQKYDWVSKDTKLNANGWSDPLKHPNVPWLFLRLLNNGLPVILGSLKKKKKDFSLKAKHNGTSDQKQQPRSFCLKKASNSAAAQPNVQGINKERLSCINQKDN